MEHYGVVWGWFGNPLAADPAHLPSLPFLPPNGGLPSHMTSTVRFDRSEEHTSELQSLMRNSYAVFCLKKKTKQTKVEDVRQKTIVIAHLCYTYNKQHNITRRVT